MMKWNIHPKWNKFYRVTDKQTGLDYPAVIVSKEGIKKVLVKETHESVLYPFNRAKNLFFVEVDGLERNETPKEFMTQWIGHG